ncbi:hypothetical protein DQ384_38200 [Sphaerisporangium album]|uniref:Uncharacterized protein n=1 Tax=Sphaerisporangium album TaxID=509200 RepID=A0A367EM22_9ACTN|nr:hypothetical protein [Sphaerisporangium album]RCG19114.1 hypothetical protein DQ384_38200 [Sphaerisporangium album]
MTFLLTEPYVTAAEFRASPTWLDTQNLVPGGAESAQDAELVNVLLRASSWADGQVNQPLGAHPHTEQMRVQIGRAGRLSVHAEHSPVRQVTALSYGPTPGSLTAIADLSALWVEDGVQIVCGLTVAGNWGGFLEFGAPSAGAEVHLRMSYVAGYASTTLAADVAAAATSITVADPIGIYPGDVLRIWDPGAEEAVTVAPGYLPGSTTVALAGPVRAGHAAGAGTSALPADAHQAVICHAAASLLREPTAGSGDYPEAPYEPAARRADGSTRRRDLLSEAARLLLPHRRVR